MIRAALTVLALTLGLLASSPALHAAPSDAAIAQGAVGTWTYTHQLPGTNDTVVTEVTLAGNGDFALTAYLQRNPSAYRLTHTGVWTVLQGHIAFKVTWSSSLDPTGRPIVLSPVRVLGFGPGYMDTAGGRVWRVG